MRAALLALLLCSCAVGGTRPDGSVWGGAIGQARIRACRAPSEAEPAEQSCSEISGGALSPDGAKAIGPLTGALQLVLGLL